MSGPFFHDEHGADLPQEDFLAKLQLTTGVDGPAQAWLKRIRMAPDFKAARQARVDATAFVASLEQRQEVTCAQADRLFDAVDRQWRECLEALESQALAQGERP